MAAAAPPEASEMVNVPAVTKMKWTHVAIFDGNRPSSDGPFCLYTIKELDARIKGKKDWSGWNGSVTKSAVALSQLDLDYYGCEEDGERMQLRRITKRGVQRWTYRIFAKMEHSVSAERMRQALSAFNNFYSAQGGSQDERYSKCCVHFFSR